MKTHAPVVELVLDRLRQFHREPEVVFWVYFFPLILIAGLGVAFSQDQTRPAVVRVAAADTAEAERVAAIAGSDASIETEVVGLDEVETAGRGGEWDVTVVVEADGAIAYRLDPRQPEAAAVRERVDRAIQEAAGRRDAVTTRTVEVRAPGSRYVDWLVPGLLGLNVMSSSMWGVGFAAVDLRMRKLLKRLRATPMRRSDFLGSLLAARLVFLTLEVVVILIFARVLFGTPIVGSVFAVGILCLLGAAAFAAISLLAGARADKIETISGYLNVVQVPMWLLSGVFFDSGRYPDVFQPLIRALPLTHLNEALRAVMLRGAGLGEQGTAVAALAVWTIIPFIAALRRFRWQ